MKILIFSDIPTFHIFLFVSTKPLLIIARYIELIENFLNHDNDGVSR
jgi:hypothetical protein